MRGKQFIRVGDAVRTAGQLKGEPTLNRGPSSTFIPRVQGVGQGSCGSFADWMRHIYWVGRRVRQIPSPYGVGGETGYTAQENLKSVNSDNMGDGRMIRLWFFHSCIPRPSLVLSVLQSLGHHISYSKIISPCFLLILMSYFSHVHLYYTWTFCVFEVFLISRIQSS